MMLKSKRFSGFRLIIFSKYLFTEQPNSFRRHILKLSDSIEIFYVVFLQRSVWRFFLDPKIKKGIKMIFKNNGKIGENLRLISLCGFIPFSRFVLISKINEQIKFLVLKLTLASLEKKKVIAWFFSHRYYQFVDGLEESFSLFDVMDVRAKRSTEWREKILLEGRQFFFIFEKKDQKECYWIKYPKSTTIGARFDLVSRSINKLLEQ